MASPDVVDVRIDPPPDDADVESFLRHALRSRDVTIQLWKLEALDAAQGGVFVSDASSQCRELKRRRQLTLEAMVQTKDAINSWLERELGWGIQSEGSSVTARLLGWKDEWGWDG